MPAESQSSLGELLGLSGEEVAALEADGVTGTAPNWSVHE